MTTSEMPILADAYSDPDVMATSGGAARDVLAQVRLTEMRREQLPETSTWSPFDQTEPDELPATVRDGDGDTWTRNARSRRWRMRGYTPSRYEPTAGRALTWQELAYTYGPLTATTDEKDATS